MGVVSPAADEAYRAIWSIGFAGVSDEALARQAGGGSQRAFAALYERYHQPLYRYCRSIVRDDADAQDALQSTLAQALSALKREQRNAPLRPWLFRIAHNEAISLIRRRGRDGAAEPEDSDSAVQASAEEEAAQRARWSELAGDLAELPERLRGALLLRELSGLSHEEIAIALGATVGAAKQAIFEARQALAEIAEGRAMECEDVRRRVSEGDGRILRGRRVRAHLRGCRTCEAFAAAILAREAQLQAFTPVLAPWAAAVLLRRSIGAASGHGGSAVAGSSVAGASLAGSSAVGISARSPVAGPSAAAAGAAGKAATVAVLSKGLAVAAVVATAGLGVAGLTRPIHHDHAGASAGASHAGGLVHVDSHSTAGVGSSGGSAGTGSSVLGHGAGSSAGAGHGAPGTGGTTTAGTTTAGTTTAGTTTAGTTTAGTTTAGTTTAGITTVGTTTVGTTTAGTTTAPGQTGSGVSPGAGSSTASSNGKGHGSTHGRQSSSKGGGASSHGGQGSGDAGTHSHGGGLPSSPPGHSKAGTPAATGKGSGKARGSTPGGSGTTTPSTPTSSSSSPEYGHAGTGQNPSGNPSSSARTGSQGTPPGQNPNHGKGKGGP